MNNLYKIENFDTLGPFLMTLTSYDDLWAYISSLGGRNIRVTKSPPNISETNPVWSK